MSHSLTKLKRHRPEIWYAHSPRPYKKRFFFRKRIPSDTYLKNCRVVWIYAHLDCLVAIYFFISHFILMMIKSCKRYMDSNTFLGSQWDANKWLDLYLGDGESSAVGRVYSHSFMLQNNLKPLTFLTSALGSYQNLRDAGGGAYFLIFDRIIVSRPSKGSIGR